MQSVRVWIPDLHLYGEIIRRGYAASVIGYNELGVRYEVYMENNEFIEIEEEDKDAL